MINFFLKVLSNNSRLYIYIIIFFTFSTTTVFGQKTNLNVSTEETLVVQNEIFVENPVKVSSSVINSNVNFILWFMGTKENISNDFSAQGLYSKKTLMTSGREPNHLLVKTLLKTLNTKSC